MPENKLYPPEGLRPPSSFTLQSLREAMEQNTVLEDRVLRCDAGHNLLLSLGGIQARIPREEVLSPWISGAQRDIAVLSRVGKPAGPFRSGPWTSSWSTCAQAPWSLRW